MRFRLEHVTPTNQFMRITFKGGQHTIYATGDLELGDSARLTEFVTAHGIENGRICFDSPGGSLIEGIRLGRAIRKLGFDTDIRSVDWEYGDPPKAVCASACAYAFAGGINRYFGTGTGRLGLHRFVSSSGQNIGDDMTQDIAGTLVSYLSEMGVAAAAFVVASKTGSGDMAWITPNAAVSIGLANNGVLPTTSELKLSQGAIYLKLEQVFDKVTSRFLIFGVGGRFETLAGIVTNAERSQEMFEQTGSSYVEFELDEYQRFDAPKGILVDQSTLWIARELDDLAVEKLQSADTMGAWTENGGAMRWGAFVDLKPVRSAIVDFIANCQ